MPDEHPWTTTSDGSLVAEISDLQWPGAPGHFMHKGRCFWLLGRMMHQGDIAGWRYQDDAGRKAVIIND